MDSVIWAVIDSTAGFLPRIPHPNVSVPPPRYPGGLQSEQWHVEFRGFPWNWDGNNQWQCLVRFDT